MKLFNQTPERRLELAQEMVKQFNGKPVTVITGIYDTHQHKQQGYLGTLIYVEGVGWTVILSCRDNYVWRVPATPSSGASPKSDVRHKAIKLTTVVDIVSGWTEEENGT